VYPVEGQERTSISPTGTNTVTARLNRAQVKVTIRATRINSSHVLFPSEFIPGAKEVTIISKMEIAVNGKNLFVPRSVFLDVFDPHEASLEFQNGKFALRITEADASNSAFILVYFDAKEITRRMVYSQLEPDKAIEDTRYTFTRLEDK